MDNWKLDDFGMETLGEKIGRLVREGKTDEEIDRIIEEETERQEKDDDRLLEK